MTFGIFCWLVSSDVFMERTGSRILETIYLIELGKSYWEGNILAETSNDKKPAVRRWGGAGREGTGRRKCSYTHRQKILSYHYNIVFYLFLCLISPSSSKLHKLSQNSLQYLLHSWHSVNLFNKLVDFKINKQKITIFMGRITVFSKTEKKIQMAVSHLLKSF